VPGRLLRMMDQRQHQNETALLDHRHRVEGDTIFLFLVDGTRCSAG